VGNPWENSIKNNMTEIEKSLEATIETSDLESINENFAEIAIDSILEDGTLKDLPIVGTIVGLSKFGFKLRENIFLKKILKFLFELKSIPQDTRQKFLKKIEASEDYNNKVGEALILIIDKLVDIEKPQLIGKLFASCISEEIDYKTFLKLSYLVDNLFLPDLIFLREMNFGKEIDFNKKEELYRVGFMTRPPFGRIQADSKNEYEVNAFGKKLLDIIDN